MLLVIFMPACVCASELSEIWSFGSGEVEAISSVDLDRDNVAESVVYSLPGITPSVKVAGDWSYNIHGNAIAPVDLDSDGYLDDAIIASLRSTGVAAIDSEGDLEWTFGTDGNVYSAVSFDIDGDGYRDEVVVGGWQNVYAIDSEGKSLWNYSKDCNFNSMISTEDAIVTSCRSVVYALNRNGDLIWSRGMPDGESVDSLAAIDLDEDGILDEVVVGTNKGRIVGLDSSGGIQWDEGTQEPGEGERVEVYAIDSNSDGKISDVVLKSGNVYLYNEKGSRSWVGTTYTALPRGMAPADFDGDGIADDVIVGKTNALYGYDARGGMIFNTTQYGATILGAVDVDSDGVVETVGWGKDKIYALKISAPDTTTTKTEGEVDSDEGVAPGEVDTDGDGVPDEREAILGLNPAFADTDGDGLTDGEEVYTYSTDPKEKDTDGDGISDGDEVEEGTDPLEADEVPQTTAPPSTTAPPGPTETPEPTETPAPPLDSDGDALSDEEEVELGTNPFNPDTDGDGIIDSLDANPLDTGGLLNSLSEKKWILVPLVLIIMLFGAYFVKEKVDEIMWRRRGGW